VDDDVLEQQEEEKGIRKISARLREKMKQNYHSVSSSANKMVRLKELLKEEFDSKMSSVEKDLYLEALDSRVKIA
jgi:hypothetical protein